MMLPINLSMTKTRFIRELGEARKGEKIIYWTGNLAHDRWGDRRVGEIASAAYSACEKGLCQLVQKRDKTLGVMLYMAVKS